VNAERALAAAWVEAQYVLRDISDYGPELRERAHVNAAHEARELADQPSLEGLADVFICLAGVAAWHGWTLSEVAAAVRAKNRVNAGRSWQQLPDGTWQHRIREAAP
jgi:hypothetical protein